MYFNYTPDDFIVTSFTAGVDALCEMFNGKRNINYDMVVDLFGPDRLHWVDDYQYGDYLRAGPYAVQNYYVEFILDNNKIVTYAHFRQEFLAFAFRAYFDGIAPGTDTAWLRETSDWDVMDGIGGSLYTLSPEQSKPTAADEGPLVITYEDGLVSHFPWQYKVEYDFYVTINMYSPYFGDIELKLNDLMVDSTSRSCRDFERQLDEIQQALTQVRPATWSAAVAQTTPYMAAQQSTRTNIRLPAHSIRKYSFPSEIPQRKTSHVVQPFMRHIKNKWKQLRSIR